MKSPSYLPLSRWMSVIYFWVGLLEYIVCLHIYSSFSPTLVSNRSSLETPLLYKEQ
ncbi:hypothetical protein GIB67_001733 [Kingdonia uniflora]|uniref:Uncharacterized protein n=1 Tax=Kingdonia uniflora TaxID=39325 RepID=A0A7J7LMZ8_9MAGN|nr:hypothetical protein GIB67_001733 [Kingdonia uniflora]